MNDFGRIVTQALSAGIQPHELADMMAVSVATVSRWSRGVVVPGPAVQQEVVRRIQALQPPKQEIDL